MIDSKTEPAYELSTTTSAPTQEAAVAEIPPPAYPSHEDAESSHGFSAGPAEVVMSPSTSSQAADYTPALVHPQPTPPPMGQFQQHPQPRELPQQFPQPRPQVTHAEYQAALGQQYQQGLLAKCAQGQHSLESTYGMCGIITAVLLFPIGLICLFADRETKCSRCGERVQSS